MRFAMIPDSTIFLLQYYQIENNYDLVKIDVMGHASACISESVKTYD
jgi:hypothetical protein